jgi:hypothetical protein
MNGDAKKALTNDRGDADIVIWPRLKAKARQLEYGTFRVRFEVHGGQLRLAEISDVTERIASF